MSGSVGSVGVSSEGKFILEYLGTAMMDSRCSYTKEMMPWIIAEILRFSGNTPVVLCVKGGRLTCTALKGGNIIFESLVSECHHTFPVVTISQSQSANKPMNRPQNSQNNRILNYTRIYEERKCFITIIKANDIYLHCRLFSASSAPQVSEVFSTLQSSASCPPSQEQPLTPSTSSKELFSPSPISPDSISFEVLYVGKLRMSYRKAPPTFIDEALDKFRTHESDKATLERRDSQQSQHSLRSLRSSSIESNGKGSSESLSSVPSVPRPTINININLEESEEEQETNSKQTSSSVPELSRSPSLKSVTFDPLSSAVCENKMKSIPHPLEEVGGGSRSRNPSGDSMLVKSLSLPVEPMRNRALSTGNYPREQVLETNRIGNSHYNRTMILIVGRCEMKIISPDAKTLLFAKHFRDIFQFSQGIRNAEHFGFICREASVGGGRGGSVGGGFVAYVFRCQSLSVSSDILKVLRQASVVSHESLGKERAIQSCDHCPMVWYRQLCAEVDGLSCDDRIQLVILKHISSLLEEDRESILTKFHGAEGQSLQEQNELLMMLLRVHCESKQVKHVHDTTEHRHEFLNQFLGTGEIFTKAKRSISNSFDHFIKRKSVSSSATTREGVISEMPTNKEVESCEEGQADKVEMEVSDSPLASVLQTHRPRSNTLGAISPGDKIRYEIRNRRTSTTSPQVRGLLRPGSGNALTPTAPPTPTSLQKHSPMMNLFQKVGSNSATTSTSSNKATPPSQTLPGSWRHAIFKKVVSPSTPTHSLQSSLHSSLHSATSIGTTSVYLGRSGHHHPYNHHSLATKALFRPRRSTEEIRELWRTAINQQIILIRMEKQNLRLRAKQQEADVKRVKLTYKELGVCDEEASDTWDLIISQSSCQGTLGSGKCDLQLLNSALLRGIPKHKRGQVWQFFIQQRSLGVDPAAIQQSLCHLNLDMTYDQLLRQLTSQQHAILIDLGRTFPTHPYFTSALGSGQLALFNILKAYSLLDTDVGYCQGLSFVAGLLLMHLEEEEAFSILKYIMFDLGAREHYKPDMHELQVKLYQLTRLIHDQDADLLLLLNHYDVLPSLYAAPWFLTLFASQFPVGFAVRVLDVLLLHGVDTIAKFAVVLILDHKRELMQCTGLEQVMECFKTVVTNITSQKLDRYLRKVLESDWDKQMLTYSVEYSVMNDEAFHAFLSESSLPVQPHSSKKSLADKSVQTSSSPPTPPALAPAEKHPILGDLIQRQNGEIAKLKQDKSELRKDVQSLLGCILTMQNLAQISTGGKLSLPVPPEVTNVASKYFLKCGTSYVGLMENPALNLNLHKSDKSQTVSMSVVKKSEEFATNSSSSPSSSAGLSPPGIPPLDADSSGSEDCSSDRDRDRAVDSPRPGPGGSGGGGGKSGAKVDIVMSM